MVSDRADDGPSAGSGGFERLHTSSVVFGIARHAKGLLVPAVLVFFVASSSNWEKWLAILFIPSAAFEVYRYFTTRFRIGTEELVVRRGLVFRNERHVPFARIQNVDLIQNPIHRLLKVAEMRVETGGGAEPEAVLKVVRLESAEALRRAVFAQRSPDSSAELLTREPDSGAAVPQGLESRESPARSRGGSTPAAAEKLLLQIPTGELLLLGLMSNRGMALILVVLGAGWEFNLFNRIEYRGLYEKASTLPWLTTPLVLAALAVAALGAMRLLSATWFLLRFHGYVLCRRGDDLRLSCGLLTRVSATVPRRRIQLVSVRQSVTQRWLGRASIRLETAGGSGGNDEAQTHGLVSRRWFVPTMRAASLPELLNEVAPELGDEWRTATWTPMDARGRRRARRKALRIACGVIIIAALGSHLFAIWWIAIAGAVLAILILWHAHVQAKYLAFARTRRGVLIRSGAWTRRISAAFYDRMQVITLHESPFDRRWKMASLAIDTAGAGPAEHLIRIDYQPTQRARELHSSLLGAVEDASAALGAA